MMESQIESLTPDHLPALDHAIREHQAGRLVAAEAGYRAILAATPEQPDALHLLGMLACDSGNAPDAMVLIDAAISLEPGRAAFHNTRARALTLANRLAPAEIAYRTAWALRPGSAEIANNLGCLLRDRGDGDGAVAWLYKAIMLAPNAVDIAGNLADALAANGSHAASLSLFRKTLQQSPRLAEVSGLAEVHGKFGHLLMRLGHLAEAEASYRAAIQLRPDHAVSRNNLGLVLQSLGHAQAAAQCFRDALLCDPQCADAHYNLGCLLLLDGHLAAARGCHERAIAAAPLHGAALWARCMVELPILYETAGEIALQRWRYTEQLAALAISASDPQVARALAASVGCSQPFFLPYQGFCDRALQTTYGALVTRLLETGVVRCTTPPEPATGRIIRVGIVSGFFCDHTIWYLMLKGWLSQFDATRFQLHAYHTGVADDAQTAVARRLCRRFVGGRGGDIRAAIVADKPDVLIYPEVGMDPVSARLSGERLAAVQCVSWGQPETSGLPTMDYFLSSALMEPADGASHYSERLIKLPGLGIHYVPDETEVEALTRDQFGLRDTATIFWCGQAVYKYLPQYDEVLVRIAAAVGDCQFLFIDFAKSATLTERFRARLHLAFVAGGLEGDRHCIWLAPMSQQRFLGTIRLADIVLDTIGWSGGRSTLDALAQAPVIVTHAGALMRGRHTAAILQGVGVTETIAATIDEYTDIAVRLASDPTGRRRLRQRMEAGRHRVMADTVAIRALEAFLTSATSRAART